MNSGSLWFLHISVSRQNLLFQTSFREYHKLAKKSRIEKENKNFSDKVMGIRDVQKGFILDIYGEESYTENVEFAIIDIVCSESVKRKEKNNRYNKEESR